MNNGDYRRLQEFLQKTPAFLKRSGRRYRSNKQLRNIPLWESAYIEPEWMKVERIRLSLPAMAEFILDDSIPSWKQYGRGSNDPLFLNLKKHPDDYYDTDGWGRKAWIRDLGTLGYKPAYDALREVWLHDLGNRITREWLFNEVHHGRGKPEDFDRHDIPKEAFLALTKLKDERMLYDIRQKLKEPDTLADSNTIDMYIHGLENFKCDAAVEILVDFADLLRQLHPGKKISRSGNYDSFDEKCGLSWRSPTLRTLLFTLHHIDTEKARDAIEEVSSWFPRDPFVCGAYRDLLYFRGQREQREERKLEIIKPEGYGEPLVGSREVNLFDIPF